MIAYTDIKTEVLANLDVDNDADSVAKFDLDNKMNAAQRALLLKVPVSEVDNILKTVTGDLTASVPYYQWPSDFVRFVKLFVDYYTSITDTNLGDEVVKSGDGVFQPRSLDRQPQQGFSRWSPVDGGFELRPMPSANVTDGFMLRYIYNPPVISSSQDSILRQSLRNALIHKTTALCALVDKYDVVLSERHDALFVQEVKDLWGKNNPEDEG